MYRRNFCCSLFATLVGVRSLDSKSAFAQLTTAPNSASDWEQSISGLEELADKKQLPQIPGERGKQLPINSASIYTRGVQRLVALQDRALNSDIDNDFNNRTALLLSQLNAVERTIPEVFRSEDGTTRGYSLSNIKSEYKRLFDECEPNPSDRQIVGWYVGKLRSYRSRYVAVEEKTTVPWYFVGIAHALEASFNFGGHLHNGDPLTRRTVQVPAGRPKNWLPPSDWLSSAVDAMEFDGFSKISDWSVENTLFQWERYNGFGYRRRNRRSPYLWNFSNKSQPGKFVRDGVWDKNATSKQCGAAVMLKVLVKSGDINFSSLR